MAVLDINDPHRALLRQTLIDQDEWATIVRSVRRSASLVASLSQPIAIPQYIVIMNPKQESGGVSANHLDEEPGGNIEHIEEHGLTIDDVEHVLANFESEGVSRSSGQPCVFGYAPDGTFIIVVYEVIDEDTIYPVTAYEVPAP